MQVGAADRAHPHAAQHGPGLEVRRDFEPVDGDRLPQLGDHSNMTSAHYAVDGGGGTPKAGDSTDKLCECDSDKGEEVKK